MGPSRELFEYDDFREYLRDYQIARHQKHSWYSVRYMATRIEIDQGYYIKILQGKSPLPERFIEPLCELMQLNSRESAYFTELVQFSRAKTPGQIRESFQKLLAMRDMEFHTVSKDQFEYFTKPHYASIRALTEILDYRDDYALLAQRLSPPISAQEAEYSVKLLERIGMLCRDDDGHWLIAKQFVTSGENWNASAIRAYQQEMFRLGSESLDRHGKELRDMSTLTITIRKNDMPELKARIAQFRKEVMQWVGEQSKEDTVMQINIQAFPLSKTEGCP